MPVPRSRCVLLLGARRAKLLLACATLRGYGYEIRHTWNLPDVRLRHWSRQTTSPAGPCTCCW
ncbi:hypothetical protein PF010_g31790 [Phytophthora fragariae]|uniref:Uncharacterized protein n=1 Tax=Phytophthora fragariae TaxID=53985 RepID=A0A6A3PHL2_9STRA|nr:hypothetical protein PF003_g18358 [Phytophthora fragariae]KAE8957072.1 hypothetical protein PF011_g31269 [Phytophthora fragariae]KAE9055214.1 hypothetical protein PF006_g33031 [Phytophthora fragariae]KAE9056368.1 hypothetical protein PF010_g31790 [Phytophthora fragariae]KAE9058408.1 hypothetical protein PF007_g31313 [Phytophthora fragariae]